MDFCPLLEPSIHATVVVAVIFFCILADLGAYVNWRLESKNADVEIFENTDFSFTCGRTKTDA